MTIDDRLPLCNRFDSARLRTRDVKSPPGEGVGDASPPSADPLLREGVKNISVAWRAVSSLVARYSIPARIYVDSSLTTLNKDVGLRRDLY